MIYFSQNYSKIVPLTFSLSLAVLRRNPQTKATKEVKILH